MKTYAYTVTCPQGLHAINAAAICKQARGFTCSVGLEKEGHGVDCKDVMAILTLGVRSGQDVYFSFQGEDEDEALEKFQEFLPTVL